MNKFGTKVLPSSLILGQHASLAKSNDEYYENFSKDQGICDALVEPLRKAHTSGKNYAGYKAVAQALFESGFIDTSDRDFNTEQLFNYIYGVKVAAAVPALEELHTMLSECGATDHIGEKVPSSLYVMKKGGEETLQCFGCDTVYPLEHGKETGCTNCTSSTGRKRYNSCGDNYYTAYTFDHEWSDSAKKVRELYPLEGDREDLELKVKVVVCENQSPMWAYVLIPNEFSGEWDDLLIVRLKCNYNDKDRLPELLELVKAGNFENNHDWSACNDTTRHGVVAKLDVGNMEVKPVLQPKHIESALFNIYSGRDSLQAALKEYPDDLEIG